MADLEPSLTRWQDAGVIDAEAAVRIRDFEATYQAAQKKPAGMRWQGIVALTLGAILLACGVVLFVNAHWDEISPLSRFVLVMAMITVFHLGGAVARAGFRGLSTALHAVGTVTVGAAIALVGQIFNIQEHWPAAILMWAVAALAGWVLLRDEAQQTLTMLLFPAWLICEWSYNAVFHIGYEIYVGRFLLVWAVLYLTILLGTARKVVRGLLFAVAAIAAVVGTVLMLLDGWRSGWNVNTFLPRSSFVWGWIILAAVPLLISLFRRGASLIPVAVAIGYVVALPWCTGQLIRTYDGTSANYDGPNILAHTLVAGFAIFIAWWGLRQASQALVNLGIVGFGLAVGWFYFSDVFDKVGRSLGLIGLGVLFLAGGWLLEKTRRRLIAQMGKPKLAAQEAL